MSEHNTLTDPNIHEPKDISTANAGEVYVATGGGSGEWKIPSARFKGQLTFDSATPAYTMVSLTTTDVVVDPTFSSNTGNEFSLSTSPNMRVVYDGTPTRRAVLTFNASVQQGSGSNKDLELVFYQNGSAIAASRMVQTMVTGSWNIVSMTYDVAVNTNDYLEVFARYVSGTQDLDFAQLYFGVQASPD